MKQEYKLYAALGAVVVLGFAVYSVFGERTKSAQARSVQAAEDLPAVKLSKDDAGKVTKFIIANKDKGTVTLEKKGDAWVLTAPVKAKANQGHIKSIIENLEKIELSATIGSDAAIHEKYELTDGKAVHVQAFKGDTKALDMYFGKAGSRGQMARIGGDGAKPTVYTTKGYSAYVWGREVRNWRHNEIITFEGGNVIAAEIENENGKFSFTKADDEWAGKLYKRDADGALAKKPSEIEKFDPTKVTKVIEGFKSLKATNFAEAKDDTGLDDALKSGGGIIRITMKDEDKPKYVIHVGKKQEGTNRFLKVEGDDTAYVVTNFSADWAIANVEKFAKAEDKKANKDDKDDDGEDDAKKDAPKPAKKDAPKPAKKDAPPKPKAPAPAKGK